MEIYLIYRKTDGVGIVPHCCVRTLVEAQSIVDKFNSNLRNVHEYGLEIMHVF